MSEPHLTRSDVADPRALLLMLHGGRAQGHDPVDQRSASWLRSRWMLSRIEARMHAAEVGVWLLRFRVRGWNAGTGPVPAPVPDARWALARIREEHGPLPVVLLGHSMGARTAVAVADDPHVAGVVGLAPWLPADEPVAPLRGRHLAVAHGRADRITSPRASEAFAQRARRVAASTEFADLGPVGHYMLRGMGAWDDFAAQRALRIVDAATDAGR